MAAKMAGFFAPQRRVLRTICAVFPKFNQAGLLDTWKRGLLNYAVFFCTEFETVYT